MNRFRAYGCGCSSKEPCLLVERIKLDDFIATYPEQIRGNITLYVIDWDNYSYTTDVGVNHTVVYSSSITPSSPIITLSQGEHASYFFTEGEPNDFRLELKQEFTELEYKNALSEFRQKVGNKYVCVSRTSENCLTPVKTYPLHHVYFIPTVKYNNPVVIEYDFSKAVVTPSFNGYIWTTPASTTSRPTSATVTVSYENGDNITRPFSRVWSPLVTYNNRPFVYCGRKEDVSFFLPVEKQVYENALCVFFDAHRYASYSGGARIYYNYKSNYFFPRGYYLANLEIGGAYQLNASFNSPNYLVNPLCSQLVDSVDIKTSNSVETVTLRLENFNEGSTPSAHAFNVSNRFGFKGSDNASDCDIVFNATGYPILSYNEIGTPILGDPEIFEVRYSDAKRFIDVKGAVTLGNGNVYFPQGNEYSYNSPYYVFAAPPNYTISNQVIENEIQPFYDSRNRITSYGYRLKVPDEILDSFVSYLSNSISKNEWMGIIDSYGVSSILARIQNDSTFGLEFLKTYAPDILSNALTTKYTREFNEGYLNRLAVSYVNKTIVCEEP